MLHGPKLPRNISGAAPANVLPPATGSPTTQASTTTPLPAYQTPPTMLIHRADRQPNFGPPIYGMVGIHALAGAAPTQYFLAVLPLSRVIADLVVLAPSGGASQAGTHSTPGAADQPAPFGTITVELSPLAGNEGRATLACRRLSPPPIPWVGNDPDDAAWATANGARHFYVDGLQLSVVGGQARLRWDRDRCDARVTEGAWRVLALRAYAYRVRAHVLTAAERETGVPVAFVLPPAAMNPPAMPERFDG